MGCIITARKRSLRRLRFYTCLSVILFTGGSTWAGTPGTRYTLQNQVHLPGTRYPPGPDTHPPGTRYIPWDQVHPWTRYTSGTRYTPGPGNPWDQVHPWDQVQTPGTRYTHPLGPGTSPGPGTLPQSSACWEIWTTSWRYASYWNAFLFSGWAHLLLGVFC